MDSVYNSPPNWPAPPAGWRPPSGWTPDPSWPAPPPGWQFWVAAPTHPPARNKRRLWLIIGLPVAGFAVLIVGGIVAFAMTLATALGPPRDAADSYAKALQAHRYEAAYAMRCTDGAGDHAAFVEEWSSRDSAGRGISSYKIVGVNVTTLNGQTVAKVNLDVKYADGSQKGALVVLTKTGEIWHPCD